VELSGFNQVRVRFNVALSSSKSSGAFAAREVMKAYARPGGYVAT
jgi:hypothetical protein